MALNIITLNNIDYYLLTNLCELDPAFFVIILYNICGKIMRRSDILKRIKINQSDHMYIFMKKILFRKTL